MSTHNRKIGRKLAVGIAAVVLTGVVGAQASFIWNNGDFQTGDTTGWSPDATRFDGTPSVAGYDTCVFAAEPDTGPTGAGDYALHIVPEANYLNTVFSSVDLSPQGAGLDDDTDYILRFDFRHNDVGSYNLTMGVMANNTNLAAITLTRSTLATPDAWTTYEVPFHNGTTSGWNGTKFTRVRFGSAGGGGGLDFYVDNFNIIPEPGAVSLLLAGVVAVRIFRRRDR